MNKLLEKLKEITRFEHWLSLPYQPNQNGAVERIISDVANLLVKQIKGNALNWDVHVPVQCGLCGLCGL